MRSTEFLDPHVPLGIRRVLLDLHASVPHFEDEVFQINLGSSCNLSENSICFS